MLQTKSVCPCHRNCSYVKQASTDLPIQACISSHVGLGHCSPFPVDIKLATQSTCFKADGLAGCPLPNPAYFNFFKIIIIIPCVFCLFWELLQTPWKWLILILLLSAEFISSGCLFQPPVVPLWPPSGNRAELRAELGSELGGPAEAGLMAPPFCLLIVVWAVKGSWELWAALHGSFPWFASCRSRQDRGSCWSSLGAPYLCSWF